MTSHKFVIEDLITHKGSRTLKGYVLHSVSEDGPQIEEARAFIQEIEAHYLILNGQRVVGVEHEEEIADNRAYGIVSRKASLLFKKENGDTLEDRTKYKE